MRKFLLLIMLAIAQVCSFMASAETTTWTFTETSGYVNSTNYATKLPTGWYYIGSENYAWQCTNQDGPALVSTHRYGEMDSSSSIFLPLKKGTVTFSIKARSASTKLAIYNATKTGDATFTLGSAILPETDLNNSTSDPFSDYTYDIPEDGYYAFDMVNGYIKSISNTYEAAAATFSISGKVEDESNTPLEGVKVTCDNKTAETAADGTYTIAGIATGEYSVEFSKPGYLNSSASINITDADLTDVDTVLALQISTLSGSFSYDYSIVHIPGFELTLETVGSDPVVVGTCTTGESGDYLFELKGLIDSSYVISGQSKYYTLPRTTISGMIQGGNRTYNPYITEKKLNFNLKVLNSADDAPVTGATVTITPEGGEAQTANGNDQGVYTISNIKAATAADKNYTINVSHADYKAFTPVTFKFDGESYDNTVKLTLIPPTVIEGFVKDSKTGTAISGASLTLADAVDPESPIAYATSGDDGKYSFPVEGAVAAKYVINASAQYYTSASADAENVVRGETYIVDMPLDPVTYTFTGHVVDARNFAIEGATLSFDGADLTAVDGVFTTTVTAKDAADKTYEVVAGAPYYKSQTAQIKFEGADVDKFFNLDDVTYTFTATVKDAEGQVIDGAKLLFNDMELAANDEGVYTTSVTAKDAADKTYQVVASAEYYKEKTVEVKFEGADVTENIVLEDVTYTFSATVKNSDGENIEGAKVLFGETELTSDADGLFSTVVTAKESAGKTYEVSAEAECYIGRKTDVKFEGADVTENFILEDIVYNFTATVYGVEENGDKMLLSDAVVSATDGSETMTVKGNGSGKYSFDVKAIDALGKTFTVSAVCEGFEKCDDYSFEFDGEDVEYTFYLNVPVGIGNIFDDAAVAGNAIYNLNGQRVRVESVKDLVPGIYVVNGRKVLVK